MKLRWSALVALGGLATLLAGCGPQPMGDETMPKTTPGREPMAATGGMAPAGGGGGQQGQQPAGQPSQPGTSGTAAPVQPSTD